MYAPGFSENGVKFDVDGGWVKIVKVPHADKWIVKRVFKTQATLGPNTAGFETKPFENVFQAIEEANYLVAK